VDFQVNKDTDRSQNKVSGKSKKGAQWLTELAPLCHVTCEDGCVYTLCSCIKGSLVEVNENLKERPQLLVEKPDTEGYIAMILTSLKDHELQKDKLLSPEQYTARLEKRKLQDLNRLADNVNNSPRPCDDTQKQNDVTMEDADDNKKSVQSVDKSETIDSNTNLDNK